MPEHDYVIAFQLFWYYRDMGIGDRIAMHFSIEFSAAQLAVLPIFSLGTSLGVKGRGLNPRPTRLNII